MNRMQTEKEFMNDLLSLQKERGYQNEYTPAKIFCQHFEKYFGQNIDDCLKNENDPPDYFLKVDGINIDLEVTTFTKNEIFKDKNYSEEINQIGNKIIEKYKSLLSPGKYSIVITTIKGKNKLERALDINIPNLFKFLKDYESAEIKLKTKDSSDEKIKIFNIGNSKKIELELIFKTYNPLFNGKNWEEKDFTDYLQTVIDNKENKYNKPTSKFQYFKGKKWLLIEDINFRMNTHNLGFDISSISIKSTLFDKIYFIQDISTGDKISELRIVK